MCRVIGKPGATREDEEEATKGTTHTIPVENGIFRNVRNPVEMLFVGARQR
jgi:hypothetical protein